MNKISFEMMSKRFDSLRDQPKRKITNKRQEIVKMFVDKLNASRIEYDMKPLPPALYAVKMAFMTEDEMYRFYGYCNDAKNFSSTWWWAMNPKNYK